MMNKRRFFKILAKADADTVGSLAAKAKEGRSLVVVKEPRKTLAMIKMREPVKNSLFYIGEVQVCEAMVELDGVRGLAVTMEDNFEKALNMAILDAACNKGIFSDEARLLELEKEQLEKEQKENAAHLKTVVNFKSMDGEAVE